MLLNEVYWKEVYDDVCQTKIVVRGPKLSQSGLITRFPILLKNRITLSTNSGKCRIQEHLQNEVLRFNRQD